MNYLKDWCRIIEVSGYTILIECYWSTDDHPDIHHVWAIKISTELDRGRFKEIEFIPNKEDDTGTKEVIERYRAINEKDIAPLLSEWIRQNDDPDYHMKRDINLN